MYYTPAMPPAEARLDAPALAVQLGLATTRLRSRLRLEQAAVSSGLSMSQLSVLGRIGDQGPTTASAISQAEHVRAQSVAETVAALRKQGLVASTPDPSDRRKALLTLTPEGRRMIDSIVDRRGAWLARAIEQHVSPDEREVLVRAADILSRLADCQVGPDFDEPWRV